MGKRKFSASLLRSAPGKCDGDYDYETRNKIRKKLPEAYHRDWRVCLEEIKRVAKRYTSDEPLNSYDWNGFYEMINRLRWYRHRTRTPVVPEPTTIVVGTRSFEKPIRFMGSQPPANVIDDETMLAHLYDPQTVTKKVYGDVCRAYLVEREIDHGMHAIWCEKMRPITEAQRSELNKLSMTSHCIGYSKCWNVPRWLRAYDVIRRAHEDAP